MEGCQDIAANNFNRDATVSDNSCEYDDEKNFTMEAFDQGVEFTDRRVAVLFQVKDENERGVSELVNSDFAVAENGRLIGTEAMAEFSPSAIPFDILTILLLDLSSSVTGLVPQIKSAASSLIDSKIENQQYAIYSFDSDVTLVQDFTDDPDILISAINSLPETDLLNSTNMYGAIQAVAEVWNDERTVTQITEGSIVLFTDGFHNANSLTVNDAYQSLVQEGDDIKKIYVAALDGPDLSRTPLEQLTAHVPMGFFEVSDISVLSNVFNDIQGEIENLSNSLYLLNYQSPITDPASNQETLVIAIKGNSNLEGGGRISTTFNSEGFSD